MKRSVLWLATLSTVPAAAFGVKAAGWFDGPTGHRPASRVSLTDAERWYRTGQERHWRAFVLQSR